MSEIYMLTDFYGHYLDCCCWYGVLVAPFTHILLLLTCCVYKICAYDCSTHSATHWQIENDFLEFFCNDSKFEYTSNVLWTINNALNSIIVSMNCFTVQQKTPHTNAVDLPFTSYNITPQACILLYCCYVINTIHHTYGWYQLECVHSAVHTINV